MIRIKVDKLYNKKIHGRMMKIAHRLKSPKQALMAGAGFIAFISNLAM